MIQVQFSDKMVSYETFLNDVASRISAMMKEDKKMPDFISKRKAYSIYGRASVDRWFREGKLTTNKRPGKIEVSTKDLQLCQRVQQDY